MVEQQDTIGSHSTAFKWLQILVIPATGWIVSQAAGHLISQAQERETNRRVYADMLSKREESESTLRKDMFQTIIQPVLTQKRDEVDRNVLRLELLAYNFHDSIDLGALFKDVYRQLRPRTDDAAEQLRTRLESVARDVISKEIDGLRQAGAVKERTFSIKKLGPEGAILMDGEEMRLPSPDPLPRLFRVEVLAFNAERKEFRMRMSVLRGTPPVPELETRPFWVGPFDFPMIDNTRLPGGQRAALALPMPVDGSSTEITLIYFPGSRASLKDKQYYEEMTGDLLSMNEQLERMKRPR